MSCTAIVIVAIRGRLDHRKGVIRVIAQDIDGIQHGREGLNSGLVLKQARLRLRRRCDQQERDERLHEPEDETVQLHGFERFVVRENNATRNLNVC